MYDEKLQKGDTFESGIYEGKSVGEILQKDPAFILFTQREGSLSFDDNIIHEALSRVGANG